MRRIDTASRLIRASPPAVFAAFSDPDAMIEWLPPSGMTGQMKSFDFRDGGSFRFRLTYNDPGAASGKSTDTTDDVEVRFARILPDRLIEQLVAFESDQPEFAGVMMMTWTFEPEEEGTRVTVRAEEVPPGIDPKDHQAGMTSTLENLARFIEESTG